jgi:hypothetical protein
VVLISEVRESEAGRAVPINGASATRTIMKCVGVINGNDNVGLKLHNITRSSDVLSDSLFNAGNIVPCYQINASILSESHVGKLSDSHSSLASSSNDKSPLDSSATLPFVSSGMSTIFLPLQIIGKISVSTSSSNEQSLLDSQSQAVIITPSQLIGINNGSDGMSLYRSALITPDFVSLTLGIVYTSEQSAEELKLSVQSNVKSLKSSDTWISDSVASNHTMRNKTAQVMSGIPSDNTSSIKLSTSISPNKGETLVCVETDVSSQSLNSKYDSNMSKSARQYCTDGVMRIGEHKELVSSSCGAKSRLESAINPSMDNSNSAEFGGVLYGPRHSCSVVCVNYDPRRIRGSSEESPVSCVDGAGSKSSVTGVTSRDIEDSFENTKHGRVLCGTCHSHQLNTVASIAEVTAEQCTEAKSAEQYRASAVVSSSIGKVVGWNRPTVLSSRKYLNTSQAESVHNDRVINIGQAESAHNRGIDTGQAESAKHNQVQVCSNVEHGRVVEYVQHSHNNIVKTGRAGKVLIDADGVLSNEVPRGYSCNYLTVGSSSKCLSLGEQSNTVGSESKRLSLNGQLNTDWSRTIFNPNVSTLSQSNDQVGSGILTSSSVGTIFTTMDSLSFFNWSKGGQTKSVWSQYFINWSKGGRTKRVWSQHFVNWSKGSRVRPRSSYDAQHQTLHETIKSKFEPEGVISQVIRGLQCCKELDSTMILELGRVLELEVSVSQASLFDDEMLRRFVLFANVLVFK